MSGGAYLIDSSICPIPVNTDDLIITARAWAHLHPHLVKLGWTPPSTTPSNREEPSWPNATSPTATAAP